MKSRVRIITVLIALCSVAVASLAVETLLEEDQISQNWTCPMHPQTVIDKPGKCPICGTDLTIATSPPAGVGQPVSLDPVAVEPAVPTNLRDVPTRLPGADRIRASLTSTLKVLPSTGAVKVLVIPSLRAKTEDLAAITEDMSIMCRIFDKKIGRQHLSSGGVPYEGNYPEVIYDGWAYPAEFSLQGHNNPTEGIYLDGYGALFLLSVNIPLAPPPEIPGQKTEEGADPTWEQAKREMHTPAQGTLSYNSDPPYVRWGGIAQQHEQYDVEKTEELKKNLIKTLKHAANIRNLKSDDWVTVAIRGTAPAVVVKEVVERSIDGEGSLNVDHVTPIITRAGYASPSATLMTIRAKKADIDAFAKADLDSDEFSGKIEVLTSYTGSPRKATLIESLKGIRK